jgi:hypothetical protein
MSLNGPQKLARIPKRTIVEENSISKVVDGLPKIVKLLGSAMNSSWTLISNDLCGTIYGSP